MTVSNRQRRTVARLGIVAITSLMAAVGIAAGPAAAQASTATTAAAHPSTATATPASASAVGGLITRSEVISRAQYWLNRGDTWYSENQSNQISDGTGGAYRPDCSGFVSMVWHLPKKTNGWDLNTGDFAHGPSPSAPGYAGVTTVGLDNLLPGDAILRNDIGHIELFDQYVNPTDHSKGIWTYAEHTTGRMTEHDQMSWSYLTGNFYGIRYRNIVDDGSVHFNGVAAGDFNGDGRVDIAGIDAHKDMRLYTGNGDGTLSGGALMWTGGGLWTGFHGIVAGDFNGDGRADIAGIDANNDMRVYTGNGNGTLSGGALMWTGGGLWNGFNGLAAGDFNGDGRADIAGIDANNDMRVYTGNGDGTLSGGALMWTGGGLWNGFHGIVAGDFNGDGRADIAGIDANNDMRLYTGNGNGTLSGGALMWTGGGLWNGFHGIAAADFNGDGRADIAGIDASSDMRLYTGNGNGTLSGGALMWPGGGLWSGF